jgi:hypothetical protein
LVKRVDRSAALDKLHNASDVTIRPYDHDATLFLAETHLDMSRGLRLGDTYVEDVVCVYVIVVASEHFGQELFDLDVVPVGVVDCGEGEEVGVWVVLL